MTFTYDGTNWVINDTNHKHSYSGDISTSLTTTTKTSNAANTSSGTTSYTVSFYPVTS